MHSSRYEARGKFGEHKRCVRSVAKSNSSFLSALQTSQVLHISMNAPWCMNQLFWTHPDVWCMMYECTLMYEPIVLWTHPDVWTNCFERTLMYDVWWMNAPWCMNQLFYNIFNPMENFFSWGICLLMSWACTIGIKSMLVQLNLIRLIY